MRVSSWTMIPLLASLSPANDAGRPAPRALPGHLVDVTAGDFFLHAPDTIASGLTTLRVHVVQGEHIAVLVRLDSAYTAADLLRARREGHPRPPWMHIIGGPGFPAPGGSANATMVLAPGHYLVMCDVAGADGVRHFEKGMFHALVVKATSGRPPAEGLLPQADAVVKMRDHVFAFSAPIRAGTRVLRVVNEGSVMHEFRLVRVLPGRTARESLGWKPGDKTPRPDEDVTALVGIVPGAELTTTVHFAQGEYVVLCVPQLAHGMIKTLRVLSVKGRSLAAPLTG
jgi:hypothetical protein